MKAEEAMRDEIEHARLDGDSVGGVIEAAVTGLPVGLGEHMYRGMEAVISSAVFAVPAVKGVEFGDGFFGTRLRGSEHNDPIGPDGRPLKNGAGGVNGGISNGAPIRFKVAFKPTSSIRKTQQTFNFATGEMDNLEVPGRHDACFALRAPVVVEAMTAIVLADLASIK
jgi:chorismate synthase